MTSITRKQTVINRRSNNNHNKCTIKLMDYYIGFTKSLYIIDLDNVIYYKMLYTVNGK